MLPSPTRPIASLSFAVTPRAAAQARMFVGDTIGSHARRDDILLATSELVTNVIRHGGTAAEAELSVERSKRGICVRVRHAGPSFSPRPVAETEPHGRGLAIVESVTDNWGIDQGFKLEVWFEVWD